MTVPLTTAICRAGYFAGMEVINGVRPAGGRRRGSFSPPQHYIGPNRMLKKLKN
jgi:hypothetical protein